MIGFINTFSYNLFLSQSINSAIANMPTSQITRTPSVLILILNCTSLYSLYSQLLLYTPLYSVYYVVAKVKVTLRLMVSHSWCRAQFGAYDQIFILFDSFGHVFVRRFL
jgi:hypothetical protein